MKSEVTYPLKAGRSIGAQRGFVKTFNWMRNFCMNLTGGPGVTVDRTDSDHPIIRVESQSQSQGIAPFTVRLHKTETDTDGLWEIYMPDGCCNVGGACTPLNPLANETAGHEDDDGAWYSLGRVTRWTALLPTSYIDNDTSVNRKRLVVKVHVKPSAKIYGYDHIDAPARRLVWADLRDAVEDVYSQTYSGNATAWARRFRGFPGDVMSFDVAKITATQTGPSDGNSNFDISINQLRTDPMDAVPPQGTGVSNFDLVWVLEPSTSTDQFTLTLDVKALYCVRQLAAAAGISVTGAEMTDVLGAQKVYARVNVTDLSDGVNTVEVLKDPDGVTISSPYVVWLPLYDLSNNVVTADYRAQSLVNLQLFHA